MGVTICEKNQKLKISCQTPFNIELFTEKRNMQNVKNQFPQMASLETIYLYCLLPEQSLTWQSL